MTNRNRRRSEFLTRLGCGAILHGIVAATMILFGAYQGLLWLVASMAAWSVFSAAGIYSPYLLRGVCALFVRLFYRFRIEGAHHIPQNGPAIITCNHVSFVDWVILASCSKRPVRILMDAEFLDSRVVRYLYRKGGVIPIAPRSFDPENLENAFQATKEALDAGEIVLIFPEGMITHDGKMNEFKRGIERILRDTPVPVIPTSLHGMWGSFFSRFHGKAMSRPFRRIRSEIRVHVGEPLAPETVTAARLQEVTAAMIGGAA